VTFQYPQTVANFNVPQSKMKVSNDKNIKDIYRIVLSLEPDTTKRSLYCKHAIPRVCPLSVRTNSQVSAFQTLIVRSPLAETIYMWSKSKTWDVADSFDHFSFNANFFVCGVNHYKKLIK
jgi:hypothetical protein